MSYIRLETDPANETPEEFRVRQLRTCQELIETGMDLAREAAVQAKFVMKACPPGPGIPGSAAAAIDRAEHRARQRHPNYGQVFAQLSRSVRQTLALQAYIFERRPMPRAAQHAPPPARPQQAPNPTAARPEHTGAVRLDALESPDWTIPATADGDIPVGALLQTIRKDLHDQRRAMPTTPARAQNPAPRPPTGKLRSG